MKVDRVADPALSDLAIRQIAANGLASELLGTVLMIPNNFAADLVANRSVKFSPAEHEKLTLFCAIMIRLEIRFGHEPRAVREALAIPLEILGGLTLEQTMATGIEGLRAAHCAVGEMVLPAERWWRITPRRSRTRDWRRAIGFAR